MKSPFVSFRMSHRLPWVACLFLALAPVTLSPAHSEESEGPALTNWLPADVPKESAPAQALRRLLEGNARYVAGRASHPDQSVQRRADLVSGQAPFAVVLACSDSRVSPEILFDQGLGDLFVIRNAGNVVDNHVLGSIEYAVEHLHASLVVVLGHEKCGAVTAAVAGGEAHGHIRSIVKSIAPVLRKARKTPGDPVENAMRCNALHCADLLVHSKPVLGEAHHAHKLVVVAARYDLHSGRVEVLH